MVTFYRRLGCTKKRVCPRANAHNHRPGLQLPLARSANPPSSSSFLTTERPPITGREPKREIGFSGTLLVQTRQPRGPDVKRGSDHQNPRTKSLLFIHSFNLLSPSSLSTAAAQLSYCHDLPAHPTQQQQQRISTAVPGLRGQFASKLGSGRAWSATLGRGGAGRL